MLEAQGSVLTNKYAEGYPGRRYYQGCAPSDAVETPRDRAGEAAVRLRLRQRPAAFSGAQANGAVMLALTKPGDTIMGLSLDAGGHLTHGAKPAHVAANGSTPSNMACGRDDHLIDFDQVEALAKEHQADADHRRRLGLSPRISISPASAPSRTRSARSSWSTWPISPGWSRRACIPLPFGHAHVVTTTTHKTLRGPRGGMVLTDDEAIAKKINSAVFPGLQGGPLMHVIAAKAVAFGEALQPDFKTYAKAVIANAQALAGRLKERGADLVAGGTDTHLALVDLSPLGITGKDADEALERAVDHLQQERRPVRSAAPGQDQRHPRRLARRHHPRLRRPAEFRDIADMVADVLEGLREPMARAGDAGGRGGGASDARPGACAPASPIYPGAVDCAARSAPMKTAR